MSSCITARDALLAQVGTEVGISNWITIDQTMIDRFAEVTRDDQWIHVDPKRAATDSPFGTTIAHGFLTLSLVARFSYDCFTPFPGEDMALNYGIDKLRFLAPVTVGARVRGRFVLTDVKQRDTRALLRVTALSVEIEDRDKPALAAETLGLLVFRD